MGCTFSYKEVSNKNLRENFDFRREFPIRILLVRKGGEERGRGR